MSKTKSKPGKTEIRFAVNKWGAETRVYYRSKQVLSIEYVSSARPDEVSRGDQYQELLNIDTKALYALHDHYGYDGQRLRFWVAQNGYIGLHELKPGEKWPPAPPPHGRAEGDYFREIKRWLAETDDETLPYLTREMRSNLYELIAQFNVLSAGPASATVKHDLKALGNIRRHLIDICAKCRVDAKIGDGDGGIPNCASCKLPAIRVNADLPVYGRQD